MRNANMEKPQLLFERPVDNTAQWKPILTKKPHATVGLDQSIETTSSDSGMVQYDNSFSSCLFLFPMTLLQSGHRCNPSIPVCEVGCVILTDELRYKHPYETEILQAKYPAQVYEYADPILYKPMDSTKAIWVDSYDGVLNMLEELKKAKEIAIDLEHHDYRSYTGLLSLMQISTRDQDWVIDTLKPWRHRLEVLNEVLADPSIVKVR